MACHLLPIIVAALCAITSPLAQDKGLGYTGTEAIAETNRDSRNMAAQTARSTGDLMDKIRKTQVKPGHVSIFWLGQGGFALKMPRNRVVIVDPYLSNSVGTKRLQPIPIPPEEVQANIVLLTHDHLDHTDPGSLPEIANACRAKFVGPLSSCEHMRKLGTDANRRIPIAQGETKRVGEIGITAVYAKHTDDSVGYVIDCLGPRVYITGDSEYDEQLAAVKGLSPDVMLVCINGKMGNMNIEQAVELTKQIGPKVVIPMHYGMFANNTADPEDFAKRAQAAGIAAKVVILLYKGSFTYPDI